MGAPVKNTCPDIDKVITRIKNAMKMANNGRKTYPEVDDLLYDIDDELSGCEDILEELRKANASLRNWGDQLEKEIAELSNT